jgi:tRNA threonylcarbamoyladenosine biosynthesis protein TsaE
MKQDFKTALEQAHQNASAAAFECEGAEQTMELARAFSQFLKGGEILALEGNLGSGKTTFVKGLALGLGIENADSIKSPTFVIMHIYRARMPIYHFDLYRLDDLKALESIGLQEFMEDKNAVTCIEWAEKANGFLPESVYSIHFEVAGEDRRKIVIKSAKGKK